MKVSCSLSGWLASDTDGVLGATLSVSPSFFPLRFSTLCDMSRFVHDCQLLRFQTQFSCWPLSDLCFQAFSFSAFLSHATLNAQGLVRGFSESTVTRLPYVVTIKRSFAYQVLMWAYCIFLFIFSLFLIKKCIFKSVDFLLLKGNYTRILFIWSTARTNFQYDQLWSIQD